VSVSIHPSNLERLILLLLVLLGKYFLYILDKFSLSYPYFWIATMKSSSEPMDWILRTNMLVSIKNEKIQAISIEV